MSKDRQQRREQTQIVAVAPFRVDTITRRDEPPAGASAKAGEVNAVESFSDAAVIKDRFGPAEIIEHAGRLSGGIVEPEYEKPVDRSALIASLPPVAPLVSCPTCVGKGKIPKPEADRVHSAPPKPPANIPKAVHHLRRAANALPPGDLIREAIVAYARTLVHETEHGYQVVRGWLTIHAAALELDHNAKGAAADVRAAIEALK